MAEFWEMDASEIAEGVTSRSYSARQVVESHLARLSEINPRINAVVQECPEEALAAANVLDDRLGRGAWRRAVHDERRKVRVECASRARLIWCTPVAQRIHTAEGQALHRTQLSDLSAHLDGLSHRVVRCHEQ